MVNIVERWKAQGRARLGVTRSETSFDADGRPRAIPHAFAPIYPALSTHFLAPAGAARPPSVLDAGLAVPTLAGRNAIALALADLGLKPGEQVALPAFHCISMVAPVAAAGGAPVFFPVEPDLSTDPARIAPLIGPSCRAVIAVHYFGFPRDFTALRAFCRDRKLIFIEDCCHAFFGAFEGRAVGTWGDYAVASTRKFFPVQEGGLLVSRRPSVERLRLRHAGARAALKSALNTIEKSLSYGRLWGFQPLLAAIETVRGQRPQTLPAVPAGPAEPDLYEGVGAAWDRLSPSIVSLAIQKFAPLARMAKRRRRNYELLAQELAGIPGVRLLFPTLPDGAVPYMLPLEIDNLAEIFPALEDDALPMLRFGQFRWPGAAGCAVADRMAAQGLQLACHDGLNEAEIRRIAAVLTARCRP